MDWDEVKQAAVILVYIVVFLLFITYWTACGLTNNPTPWNGKVYERHANSSSVSGDGLKPVN